MYAWSVDDTVVNSLRSAGVRKSSNITRMSFSGSAMYFSYNGEDGTVPMTVDTATNGSQPIFCKKPQNIVIFLLGRSNSQKKPKECIRSQVT